ncbi:MAG: phage integrase SAM-like domain-containing protein [Prevotella sp.]|nr:phage integrase SAM-like domain-containing protein [Prevotella sp.]
MKKMIAKALDGFFLRTRRREGWARLYYRLRRNGHELTLRTNITVDIELWSAAIQTASGWRSYTKEEVLTGGDGRLRVMMSEGGRVARAMAELAEGMRAIAGYGTALRGEEARRRMAALVARCTENGATESRRTVMAAEMTDTGKGTENKTDVRTDEGTENKTDVRMTGRSAAGGGCAAGGILAFYEFFMEGITAGLIRHHKGRRYTVRSIGVWREFGPVLRGYVGAAQTFDDVDRLFIDGFRLSLEQRGLMETTIEGHVACFRKLCRAAAEYGRNHNAMSLTGWKCHRVGSEAKRAEVYLTAEEIDGLCRLELREKTLDEVRDLFVLGYLSFQRWSDYSRLDATSFIVNSEGVRVMALRQQKTGTYVEVPLTDDRVDRICRKYDYDFPKVSRKRMNELLKVVMRRLAERLPSMRERYVTVLTAQERRAETDYGRLKALREAGVELTPTEWRRYRRLRREAERRGGMPLFARDGQGRVVREKHELVTTHTSRRSGITNIYKSGMLDNREMMALSGHKTERVLEDYIKVGPAEQAKRIYRKIRDKR